MRVQKRSLRRVPCACPSISVERDASFRDSRSLFLAEGQHFGFVNLSGFENRGWVLIRQIASIQDLKNVLRRRIIFDAISEFIFRVARKSEVARPLVGAASRSNTSTPRWGVRISVTNSAGEIILTRALGWVIRAPTIHSDELR